MELTDVVDKIGPRKVGHVTERTLVGASINMRPDLLLGHYCCCNARILYLLTCLALLDVPFYFCQLYDLLTWGQHICLVHFCSQLWTVDLLTVWDSA